MDRPKLLIFIPTYNEADNVRTIHKDIRTLGVDADILFCDDNSPDGTGRIIDDIRLADPRVFVIHREGKKGIGTAHASGINWAYTHGYQQLITMDCDFSHSPSHIKQFLVMADEGDVIIGSRYIQKGSLKEWNPYRKMLTHIGHFLTHKLLGMPFDATGAFRLYRLDKIPQGLFQLTRSHGYSFFFELLYILMLNKFVIREVSIYLPARTYGHSKMTVASAYQSFIYLLSIYLLTLFRRHEFIYTEVHLIKQIKPSNHCCEEDWDAYWKKGRGGINILYDAVAYFYRFCVIKKALNHFIRKYFSSNSVLLHAGCGSGQVDVDISKEYSIHALDISSTALTIYKKYNPRVRALWWADIFSLPLKDGEFDGIYNLGVMEHFNDKEIQQILGEFHRVLKTSGRIIIFWPPEFGLATRFLRAVHYVFNDILGLKVKLHPAEPTRIRSREHMVGIFEKAGFRVMEYYFGNKDCWTHSIMVAEK